MNSGIYEIVCEVSGRRYIGSAVNFKARWNTHRSQLRRSVHHSRHLQRAWDKHGEDKFSFRKLLVCGKENLVTYEQILIDGMRPEFNSAPECSVALISKIGSRKSYQGVPK